MTPPPLVRPVPTVRPDRRVGRRRPSLGRGLICAGVALGVAAGPSLTATAASAAPTTAAVTAPVAGTAGVATAAAGVATAAAGRAGLYGTQDPTYDGVLRQGYALVALRTAGAKIPASAVAWLLLQQCGDGSFTSYRPNPAVPCTGGTPNAHDTNATAAAVIGLRAAGTAVTRKAAIQAVKWLESVQNPDGGVGYTAGAATDSNSTGLFVQSLVASGINPVSTLSVKGKNPFRALIGRQVGCAAAPAARGALDYQTEKPLQPNSLATTGALLGLAGGTYPVSPKHRSAATPTLNCAPGHPALTRAGAARAAGGWTARTLSANAGVIISFDGRTPDVGQTVNAVLGLVDLGVGSKQVTRSVLRLKNGLLVQWVTTGGRNRPAAAAAAILLAHALGGDPRNFGGQNYVARLLASGPRR